MDKKRVFFVSSEGMQVTHWFATLLRCIPEVEFVNSIEECDVVCIGDLTTNNHLSNVTTIASYRLQYAQKPLCIFLHDDPDKPMGFVAITSGLRLFRTSMCASLQESYETYMPSFQCADQKYECLPVLQNEGCIRIGFVGAKTSNERVRACELLTQDARFRCSFVIRNAFHGHFNQVEQQRNNLEYKANLTTNMYQLCCRGAGNFSHRFYEVLASGRIPVLPDTDIVIPNHIPPQVWRNCVVLVSNVETIPDAVYAFHMTHEMQLVQHNCRQMWSDYLSYEGFSRVVASFL